MNKYFIIFALLFALTNVKHIVLLHAQNTSLGCAQDSTKKACEVLTSSVTPTVTYATYGTFADQQQYNYCNYASCAWVDRQIQRMQRKQQILNVKAISNRCITMGFSGLKLFLVVQQEATSFSLCTTNNTCVYAHICERLPMQRCDVNLYKKNWKWICRQWKPFSIYSNILTSFQWEVAFKDKICDNASTKLPTGDSNKTFSTDGTCQTNGKGGCVTRTICTAATIEASSIKNSTTGDNSTGTVCVDKKGTNASTIEFLTGCITKSSGKCVTNGACLTGNEVAYVKILQN